MAVVWLGGARAWWPLRWRRRRPPGELAADPRDRRGEPAARRRRPRRRRRRPRCRRRRARQQRHAAGRAREPALLLATGGRRAHRHADERSGRRPLQADGPVAAVRGRADDGVDAARQTPGGVGQHRHGDLRGVHADEQRRRVAGRPRTRRHRRVEALVEAVAALGTTSKPGASHGPGSPSSTSTRRRAGVARTVAKRVGQGRRRQRRRLVGRARWRAARLRSARRRRLGQHDHSRRVGQRLTRRGPGACPAPPAPCPAPCRSPSSGRCAARTGTGTSSMRHRARAASSTISSGQPDRRSLMSSASSGRRRAARIGPRSDIARAGAASHLGRQQPVGEPGVERPRPALGSAARRARGRSSPRRPAPRTELQVGGDRASRRRP